MSVIPSNTHQIGESSSKHKRPQIWAVASGKGGVGKSFVAANLGMALAQHGKKTVLVDLDLGSANMHTCLGISNPKKTLSDLLKQNSSINDLVVPGHHPNIGLISGAEDDLQMANLKHFQKLKIMRNLSHLDADYVILDLGAGTSFNTLDFFLFADQALLTIVPEPTSVENSYRFIKCILSRKLKTLPKDTKKVMNNVLALNRNPEGKPQSFTAFLTELLEQHPEHGSMVWKSLKELNINLIVNQVIDPTDTKLGPSMEVIFRKYFGLKLGVMGYLYHDIHVIQSLKQKQAYYQQFPQSRNAICLNRIATKLIEKDAQKHKPAQGISL